MEIRKPAYYDRFLCIAGACPDSCCKEWDVQIDPESAAFYRSLPGALGDRLRAVMRDEDGETLMTIENGRCPMWRDDGLCRIQAELGEQALSCVCREFPRLRHDYGDFTELGLELSCPEAAKLILSCQGEADVTETVPGGEEGDYDSEAMACLKHSRQIAKRILTNDCKLGEVLTCLLLYGYQAQAELDGEPEEEFDAAAAPENARNFAKEASPAALREFFGKLELLTDDWAELLRSKETAAPPKEILALAGYLIDRYWLQAVSDYDLVCRVKFIIVSCLLVGTLPGDFTRNAQLFSKEIENDAENVDAILDAAYEEPAFTDEHLLGMLLK